MNMPDPASIMTPTELAAAVRTLYESRFTSLRKAATATGLTHVTISTMIRGTGAITPEAISRFITGYDERLDVGPWVEAAHRVSVRSGRFNHDGPHMSVNVPLTEDAAAALMNLMRITTDSTYVSLVNEAIVRLNEARGGDAFSRSDT
jgi:plasmid maintenance system antidote protein VapI